MCIRDSNCRASKYNSSRDQCYRCWGPRGGAQGREDNYNRDFDSSEYSRRENYGNTPVSYTHLDVYKRQLPPLL